VPILETKLFMCSQKLPGWVGAGWNSLWLKCSVLRFMAYELVDPWFDTVSLLGGFCTLFVLEKRFLRADVIS
jgi:hypothetical protein